MYGTLTNFVRGLRKEEYLALKEMCEYSNNLYNVALYSVRQHFFDTGLYLSYESNYHICKSNENYHLLQSSISQQTMKLVDRSFKTFFTLNKMKKEEKYDQKVRIPHYREKGNLFILVIPVRYFMFHGDYFHVPMSKEFKRIHPGLDIKIPISDEIKSKNIKEVHIVPVNNGKQFKIQYLYQMEPELSDVSIKNIISIDLGIDNFASCVTTLGESFVMDGRYLKSINQGWNKRKAYLLSIAHRQGVYNTNRINAITTKRNNRIKDVLHKIARYIINYCLDNKIGVLVIGYSSDFTQNVNLGKKNNQNFTTIPYGKFCKILKGLCDFYGIQYIEQEESYTSKSSFLDNDVLPVFDKEKSYTGTFSGKRIHRGLYESKDGTTINADINGAANILRKTNLDYDKEGLKKAVLSRPQRIKLI